MWRSTLCRCAIFIGLTLLAGPHPGWSWGCEGHEIIAQIAQRHLTAQARGAVRALLGPTPIDPRLRRFCPPVQNDLLAQVSTWADDVRRDERSPFFGTGQWHFINLPRGLSAGVGSGNCPGRGGCITSALEQELGVLRDLGAERKRRAEALMMVVHLIGDLHQPLHCATNNDAGGNCVPVAYFHTEPRLSGERADSGVYQPNLHSIWDTSIIRHIMARRSTRSVADLLEKRFEHRIASWEGTGVDIRAWAFETHAVAA